MLVLSLYDELEHLYLIYNSFDSMLFLAEKGPTFNMFRS